MADYKKPTRKKCPECGRKTIEQLLGNVLIADSVNIGRTKPDATYNEVISKINEGQGIKGTRYELEGQIENREKIKQKPITKHEIKDTVRKKLKGKLRVGD